MNINTHMLIKDRKGEQMLLINWKYQKKIIILVLLGAFISCPTTGMCYAAEILSDNCVQESSKTVPIQKELIQESHYIAPDETAEFSISDEDANNITADSFSAQENLRIDTELQGENISAAVKDYTNFEEAKLDIDNEKLALAIEKTGETTMTNNNDESVIKAGMSTKQKQQAIEKLMKKYGYRVRDIKDALKYIDWSKVTTDFAPTFYTSLKNGDLYFWDSSTYKYVFDEQVMKKMSVLIDEMKKSGYIVGEIKYVLKYIDWSKATTDFAPSFYIIVKNYYIADYITYHANSLYKYVFDEQVMKNVSTLIEEMRMYGYSVSEITDVLKYTDWEKRKTTDFVPSFYTIVKNGYLVYLNNCSTNFLYKYVFDEQMMKNLFVLIDEMKKSGYDKKDITDALSYINWKKVKNNFNQIINIVKLNYNSLIVLHYMNYDKPAATYEILKVMKNNSICSNEDNMRFIFENYSNEIYGAYEKIYNDEKITNKEENLKKEFKKNENAYKRQVSINKSKNLLDKTLNVFKTTVIYVTAPIWMTALALYMAIGSTMDEGL